jgi:hypothetical protein
MPFYQITANRKIPIGIQPSVAGQLLRIDLIALFRSLCKIARKLTYVATMTS